MFSSLPSHVSPPLFRKSIVFSPTTHVLPQKMKEKNREEGRKRERRRRRGRSFQTVTQATRGGEERREGGGITNELQVQRRRSNSVSWAATATRAHTHNRLSFPSFFLGADFFPQLFFLGRFVAAGGRKGAKLPLPLLKAHMNTGRFLGRRRRRYKKIKGFLFLLLRLLLRIIGGKEKEEEEHLLCQMKETPIS